MPTDKKGLPYRNHVVANGPFLCDRVTLLRVDACEQSGYDFRLPPTHRHHIHELESLYYLRVETGTR